MKTNANFKINLYRKVINSMMPVACADDCHFQNIEYLNNKYYTCIISIIKLN